MRRGGVWLKMSLMLVNVGNQGSLPQSRDDYVIILVWRIHLYPPYKIQSTLYNTNLTYTAHIPTVKYYSKSLNKPCSQRTSRTTQKTIRERLSRPSTNTVGKMQVTR